jgi:D-alanyl-D-alanine carboxypeptidase (penicillin-binding protein 5/6)
MAIVLGAASENARANEAQKLLNWGFTVYEAVKLFDGNQPVVSPPVWKGRASVVKIGLPQPIVVAVPTGTASRLRTEVVRRDPLVAPFQLGQTMGSLRVRLDGQAILSEVPLVALEGVEEAGLIGRAWDSLRLWIK